MLFNFATCNACNSSTGFIYLLALFACQYISQFKKKKSHTSADFKCFWQYHGFVLSKKHFPLFSLIKKHFAICDKHMYTNTKRLYVISILRREWFCDWKRKLKPEPLQFIPTTGVFLWPSTNHFIFHLSSYLLSVCLICHFKRLWRFSYQSLRSHNIKRQIM